MGDFASFQLGVKAFAGGADSKEYREPDDRVGERKNKGKDQQHQRLKGDPAIEQITANIGYVDGEKVEEQGFGKGPLLNLIEHAGTRLQKSKQIGGKNGDQNLTARQGKALNRKRDTEIK